MDENKRPRVLGTQDLNVSSSQTVSQQSPQDDSQTTVKHLNKESEFMPVFTPEFRQFFEVMFEEVLTSPDEGRETNKETKEAEINEIHQELQVVENRQTPQENVSEPVLLDQTIHGMSHSQAVQGSAHVTSKTVKLSFTWLTALIAKVFKSHTQKGKSI